MKMGKKFSKRVENNVGKGEITSYVLKAPVYQTVTRISMSECNTILSAYTLYRHLK